VCDYNGVMRLIPQWCVWFCGVICVFRIGVFVSVVFCVFSSCYVCAFLWSCACIFAVLCVFPCWYVCLSGGIMCVCDNICFPGCINVCCPCVFL
jgi:hypothetical protein